MYESSGRLERFGGSIGDDRQDNDDDDDDGDAVLG